MLFRIKSIYYSKLTAGKSDSGLNIIAIFSNRRLDDEFDEQTTGWKIPDSFLLLRCSPRRKVAKHLGNDFLDDVGIRWLIAQFA